MISKPFPRADDSKDLVGIAPRVWNRLCAVVEAMQRITGAAPISVKMDLAGPIVSLDAPAAPAAVFAVDLTQVGGADGNAATSTSASWTYDVYLKTGVKIASAQNPEAPRLVACLTNKATTGMAYYSTSGDVVLKSADESYGYTTCS